MTINMDADTCAFNLPTSPGITAKPQAAAAAGKLPPASPSSSEVSSVVSSDDDSDLFGDDVTSSDTTPGSSTDSLTSQLEESRKPAPEPLQDMSSLLQELPIKRGLSRFYNGKSQSFTSLANVTSVEDLAKPENPYNKRLKTCKSYSGLYLSRQQPSSPKRMMPRKGSCSSLCVRRNSSFLGNGSKPPVPPPSRSSSANLASQNSQPSLFAWGV